MKKILLLLASLSLSPCLLKAQNLDVRRHIEVDGSAKVLADADRALWQIKIRGEAVALADASKLLEVSAESLRQRLAETGLAPEALRLSGIASGKHYEGEREARVFKGYYAERSAVVELKDLTKRQVLEAALLSDEQLEIVQVELRTSNHEELRKQVLLAAVAAAKEKASALAREAGAEISLVLAIRESNAPSWGAMASNRLMDAGQDAGARLEFEQLEYNATVTVKFELK